jgi:galactokinase/mevalonate kinase-like predicted kinase
MLRMPSWRSTFGQHRESGGGLSTFPKTNSITTRARAPLRLGLAGGGSDLSPYCDEFGGAVLNTTIDRFAYAFISPRDDGRLVFCAKDLAREEVLSAEPLLPEATLQLHRGVYERMVRDYNKGQPIAAHQAAARRSTIRSNPAFLG